MKDIKDKLRLALRDPVIRKKIIFTFFLFFVFRLFAFLPVPTIDLVKLKDLFAQSQFLSLLDIFSGGTLVNFSVMAIGLNPYITASIIVQLLTVVFPKLEALAKEGEYGRHKINQYTRMLTAPLALVQSIGIYVFLQNQKIISHASPLEFLSIIFTLIAGTFIVMWFGELISEFGLGNGISLIIFVGIVGRLPVVVGQTFSTLTEETYVNLGIFLVLALFVIAAVVFINQAVRRIPVFYAKRIKGNKMYQAASNYLPLKLNQAGVIPIIFAVAFVLFPQLIGNFLMYTKIPALTAVASFLVKMSSPSGFFYNFFYFVLVVAFTFFYTVIVFNPQKISEEIQKNGGFIPGIRPGMATRDYLQKIVYRVTTVGAVFLGLIAILPAILSSATGIQNILIGGTSILIVVSVVLETFKAIEAQLVMKSYDKFTR